MKLLRRVVSTCLAVIALAGASVAVPHTAGAANPAVKVLVDGLSSPKGLTLTSAGDPVVSQGAFGAPGPVLLVPNGGKGTPIEVTDPASLTDVAISPLDETGWGIGPGASGDVELVHEEVDGSVVTVLNITAYQATDPDPVDQDLPPNPGESNPYGLAILPNGDALVADAANNDLLRVRPNGQARTVARFDVEPISTDHLPPEMGLPPVIRAEAVPTSVAIGPDGAIYVGELKGFPFRPGTSHVWRIEPDARNAWCSTRMASSQCSVSQAGFTGIQDITFHPNNGRLYVLELAADGVLAFEEGFVTGVFPPARLLVQTPAGRIEIGGGLLSQPGGVAISGSGKVFVTDGMFTGGRLVSVVG